MTTVKKTIGRLPQNLGPWEQGRAYKRRNRANCLGSELESLVDNNTDCPCTYDEATGKVVVSPKWRIVTDGRAAYEFSRQYPDMKEDWERRIEAGEKAMSDAVKAARESTQTVTQEVIDTAKQEAQEVIEQSQKDLADTIGKAKDDVADMVEDARKEVQDFIDLAQKGYRPEIDEETETLNLVCLGGATATVDAESETLELTF